MLRFWCYWLSINYIVTVNRCKIWWLNLNQILFSWKRMLVGFGPGSRCLTSHTLSCGVLKFRKTLLLIRALCFGCIVFQVTVVETVRIYLSIYPWPQNDHFVWFIVSLREIEEFGNCQIYISSRGTLSIVLLSWLKR